MATIWFLLVAAMLVAYVVLDGFDLGVGVLYKLVARTPDERNLVRRSIGPVWDANEVWLLAAGGTLYFAFPALYASSFSGFYLPLMLVLWLLIGRALGLELRGHLPEPLAQEICDAIFMVSSTLLAVILGAALGNVVRGVPLDAEGYFFLPLWTRFSPFDAEPGVLDWYTVLCGVVTLIALATHGGHYLVVRTSGLVAARAQRLARLGTRLLPVATLASLLATLAVRPGVLANFKAVPVGLVLPAAVVVSLAVMEVASRRGREEMAFGASCAYLVSMLGGAAFALYPVLLPSSGDPARSLTVAAAATSSYGMRAAMAWWGVAVVIVAFSFRYLYRSFRGKLARRRRVRLRRPLAQRSLADGDVVDEARLPDEGGDGQDAGTVDHRHRLQRARVDQLQVIEAIDVELGARCRHQDGWVLLAARRPCPRGEQRSRQRQGARALGRRQVGVARRHRQTVRLTHRRNAHDPDAHVQVGHHAADDRQLLVVLFSEQRHVRPNQVEQLANDGGHADEVARAVGTIEAALQLANLEVRLEAARVHVPRAGDEGEVDARPGWPWPGRRPGRADSGRSPRWVRTGWD